MQEKPLKIDVYYDFSCPWCYVGYLRYREGLRRFNRPVNITEHVYMIDTSINKHGEDYLEYNVKRWGNDAWVAGLKRNASKDGATFANWKYWPNSFNAHRLTTYARSIGFPKIEELNLLLFHLCYEEGENISEVDVLSKAALKMGIEDAEEMLRSDRFKSEVMDEDEFAKKDLEIQCVPYFVINNRYYLEGANPPSAFSSVFRMLEKNEENEIVDQLR